MLLYVWFRFDWQYGVGVVVTLLLDVTKTIGFLALTQLQFDLNTVAAILTLIGYSVTDKIVVYDRIRENVRKHRSMGLREVIDLSINQTLGRTVATSLTVLLSILPLALIGHESIRDFAITIIFGIIVGTSSSIFIAAPILLHLGQRKLTTASPAAAPRRPCRNERVRQAVGRGLFAMRTGPGTAALAGMRPWSQIDATNLPYRSSRFRLSRKRFTRSARCLWSSCAWPWQRTRCS